jgi:hypothetical protein
MKTPSTFSVTAALIAGSASCAPAPTPTQYNLTISNTEGDQVTTPGVGTFPYNAGTVVDLEAAAEEGCHFANWAGDVDTIVSVQDATITITMNDNHSIAANFQYLPMVAAGVFHTLGLTSDRTLVAEGWNGHGQCDVDVWTDIIQVAAGQAHRVGLKSNDTVVSAGLEVELAKWNLGKAIT